MALTAAQYKEKFDYAQKRARDGATFDWGNSRPEFRLAWSQVAGVWLFLSAETAQMTKHGVTPSAANVAYANEAERLLGLAQADLTSAGREPQALSWVAQAGNAATAWLEYTRAETELPA